MSRPINEQTWHRLTEEMMTGMREWRSQHPKATLREMENELDARWVRVRARMLEDMALASVAASWADTPNGSRPSVLTAVSPCSYAARTPARSRPTAGKRSQMLAFRRGSPGASALGGSAPL